MASTDEPNFGSGVVLVGSNVKFDGGDVNACGAGAVNPSGAGFSARFT